MGITRASLDRLEPFLGKHLSAKILILGCQNIYSAENYGDVAHDYFKSFGHDVKTIDILGCQGAEIADLRDDLGFKSEFDFILQHGTIEHIDGDIYQAFKNVHEACIVNGVMIHENPKTGNWPGHGQHYFTKGFYNDLAKAAGYDLIEVTEEAAMGNYESGWNICAALVKMDDEPFISKLLFNKIYKKHVHAK